MRILKTPHLPGRFLDGLFIVTALSLGLVSCSLDRYHAEGQTAEVTLELPKRLLEPSVLSAPSTYTTTDCFLVDVNGNGISPMYGDDSPFGQLDLGLNSAWIQRTALVASGVSTLSVRVPIGKSRTIRILGITGSPAIADCPSKSFSGYPTSGIFALPPYPVVHELARATVDVFTARASATSVLVDASQDIIPSTLLSVVTVPYSLLLGNTASDFSEGAPSGTGGFQALALPMSTGALAGKTRFDFIVQVGNLDVRSYRGLQFQVRATGGSTACAGDGSTILTPSNLTLGLWQETPFTWSIKDSFIPSGGQASAQTTNFSGTAIASIRTPVTAGGSTFNALYLSLRTKDVPSTGCSSINVSSVTATLYQ
jgi:hypothetical protein